MENNELVKYLLECTLTCKDVVNKLFLLLKNREIKDFSKVCSEFKNFLNTIQLTADKNYKRDGVIKLGSAAESVLYSLDNIIEYYKYNIPLALQKIEFELIPFVETMYSEYYFWSSIYPYREKWNDYYNYELSGLYSNKYINKSVQEKSYKYDLSVVVVGYNKLDYTKLCVQSVINNLPQNISCELILLNHGSEDGTKEYFESLMPTKQMDIKINGSLNNAYTRIIEGEYYLAVSNDTIFTPNSINNMLRAIKEDSSIGRIVPTTPNVSNLQTIPAEYSDLKNLMEWAEKNNVYDKYRHEIRTRLCDPISLIRSKTFISEYGINMIGRYYTSSDLHAFSFPDDETSMLLRRVGLVNVLSKDAYCYHFGSITINTVNNDKKVDANEKYKNGRIQFAQAFGIDPWGTGFCYDGFLFENFECKFEGKINILGINCGMGSNSLKIKELYKELTHNLDVYLFNMVDDTVLINENSAFCENVELLENLKKLSTKTDLKYHYIVFEDPFKNTIHQLYEIEYLSDFLIDSGELYIKTEENFKSEKFKSRIRIGDWLKLVK